MNVLNIYEKEISKYQNLIGKNLLLPAQPFTVIMIHPVYLVYLTIIVYLYLATIEYLLYLTTIVCLYLTTIEYINQAKICYTDLLKNIIKY